MFYGATKPEIAVSEVRPPVGSHVVVAPFKVIRALKVLDLRQLGAVSLKPDASLFDPKTVKQATRRGFLRGLTQMIVMPVVPEQEDHRYVVTQAIADFLATHPKLNLDGIIFPSAQHSEADAGNPGSNVILFNKASGVRFADEQNGKQTQVHLFEHDEDGERLEPMIWTKDRREKSQAMWDSRGRTNPALALNLDAISIYEIKGVKYDTSSYGVRRAIDKSPQENPASNLDF